MTGFLHHRFEVPCLYAYISWPSKQIEWAHLLFFNQCPCLAASPSSSRSTNAMHVLANVDRNVIADNVSDVTDVQPSGYQIRTHEAKWNY